MVGRVLFDAHGLLISRGGVEVTTAAIADMQFRAVDGSAPVILKATVALVGYGTVTTLSYGQTLPQVPMSILFWTPAAPTAGATQYMLIPMGNMNTFTWPVGSNANGDTTFFFVNRYADRIEMWSERDYSSGPVSPALGGYVSAVIYDMR